MPDKAVKGEQLGVRIALFNYWNTALEVSSIVEDECRVYRVACGGGGRPSEKAAPLRGKKTGHLFLFLPHLGVSTPVLTFCVSVAGDASRLGRLSFRRRR